MRLYLPQYFCTESQSAGPQGLCRLQPRASLCPFPKPLRPNDLPNKLFIKAQEATHRGSQGRVWGQHGAHLCLC